MMLAQLMWRSPDLWPAVAVLALIVIAGLFHLYPPQLAHLRRRWRWLLPTLRLSAMSVLFVSILRPTLLRTISDAQSGAVAVIVDRSRSMGVADHVVRPNDPERRRVVAQAVSLADSLRRLPQGARSSDAAKVYEDLQALQSLADQISAARRELDYATLIGREPGEAQKRLDALADRFLSDAHNAEEHARTVPQHSVVTAHLARLSRQPKVDQRTWIRQIRETIANAVKDAQYSQQAIDDQLYQRNDDVRIAADELTRMTRQELAWEALCGEGGLLWQLRGRSVIGFAAGERLERLELPSRPGGGDSPQSDAAASNLVQTLGRVAHAGAGQAPSAIILFSDGRETDPLPPQQLPSGTPVFPVYCASPYARDLAVESVQLPRVAFVGERIRARIVARNTGYDAGHVTGLARMEVAGASDTAALESRDEHLRPAELSVIAAQPGVHRVTLSVPIQDGEVSTLNNQVERWIKVIPGRLKVLAVAGSPNWDFRYLCSALAQTPWIESRQAVVAPRAAALAMTAGQILDHDLIILSDVPSDALSAEQWDAIRRLVVDRGGSVIVIPGLQPVSPAMADLLPFAAGTRPTWRIWPGPTPFFKMAPASGQENCPAIQFSEDAPENQRIWQQLPGFYRYLAIPQLRPAATSILLESDSGLPLLTQQPAGAGRAFFLAMNETWRWRELVGPHDQQRFWLQLIRYAAEEPYAARGESALLDLDPPRVRPGETVHIRARMIARAGTPLLRVSRQGQIILERSLQPAGVNKYRETLDELPEGEYEVALALAAGGDAMGTPTCGLTVAADDEREMGMLAGDRVHLEAIAEATGGRCLNLDQVSMVPELLSRLHQSHPRVYEIPIWQSGFLFIFVVSCLTAEWALRKKLGLA